MSGVRAADREELLAAAGAADERSAIAVATRLLGAGATSDDVLLDLVAPVQVEVGARWQANLWNVAREHAATAVVERVIAAVASHVRPPPARGHVVVACLSDEWHAVPPRIVAEVLRGRGWRVTFLGASVPGPHLVAHLHEHGPDAVALSCTLSRALPQADRVVAACRGTGTPVLVGGAGFGADGRWARALGIPTWAPDAASAAELLDGDGWRGTGEPGPPRAPAPEYAALRSRRGELVAASMVALHDRFPPLRGYDERQLDATAEDLGHVVDFLAAAVYVDDRELFGRFLAWTCDVLHARGVPPSSTGIAMDEMARVLVDHPRARHHLDHGRRVVAGFRPTRRAEPGPV
ncbi:cobalamin B12-binding domain-containing protein [Saccharothrix sp. Mg75]|uniref:cobalamin B12-binding domain-containing protein n=1 Tax=Saccharothrix sp. Mg75 TaxID=3445357 RepID=UPI003EEAD324